MTESGGVSGILGTDGEANTGGSILETQTPLDPTAAALAAEAAKSDPELAKKASAYFDKQSHLVEVQTEHLHEQRAVNLQLLKLRRVEAAILRLKTTPVDEKNASDVASAASARAQIAEAGRDFKTAAREWDAFAAAYANPTVSTGNPQVICLAAVTYEKTGQAAKADAALNAVDKLTYVDCYRFRGDVMDLRGNWAGAQDWYAKAVQLGPSIPSGYYSWGLALANHGDLDGAAAKLKDAHQRGPHWADPLKAWGDVLVKQGKTQEALAKYNEALKYAPKWKQLQEARDSLAKQKT